MQTSVLDMQNPDYVAKVAAEVRAGLGRKRFTMTQFAERLNVSQPTASRCLAGERPLNMDELFTLATWLDTPVTDLLAPALAEQAEAS